MIKRIKLIWDFRGPNSVRIAEHHCIHLKEYAQLENLNNFKINISKVSKMYTIAYMIVDEIDMDKTRQQLKPHRGQLAN